MASKRVPEYQDPDSAQRASRHGRAVSKWPIRVFLSGPRLGYSVLVDIVMERGRPPRGVYHSAPGVDVPRSWWTPSTREIDSMRGWRAY